MPGKIELHYCSNLYHLTDHFLKKYLPPLETNERIHYIVNDSWRVQQLTNDWLLRKTGDISSEYPFISYPKWLSKLGNQLNIIPHQLKLAERCILLRSVVEQKRQALQYFRFQGTAFPADLLRTLVLFFDRIRLNEADADILQEVKDRLILNSSDKLQSDLSMLFSAYLDGQRQSYLDEAGLLTAIIRQHSPEFLRKYYPQLSTIVFEDISHFQKLHIRFFEHWKVQGIHLIFLLPYGRNPDIFSHKNSLFNKIESIADHVEGYHGVNKLSNSLFQIKSPQFDFLDKIRILPAANRIQEVENLAAQIKKLVTDAHWPFSVIGISSPQLLSYHSILEMVFNRFKIPCSFLEGRPLEQAFVLKNLGWYIELVKDDYPRNILHKILQSPLFSYRQKLSNPDVLELVPLFRVKSGKKEIQDFLSRQIQRQKMSIKQEDEEKSIRLPIGELKETVDELFLEVQFFEKSQTAAAIYRHLVQMVNRHKIFEKILDQSRLGFPELSLNNHGALGRFFELLQFWFQLQPTAKYSVQKFWEIFSTILQLFNSHPRIPSKLGVQIVPLTQICSQKYKALFVIGMEEGILPSGKTLNITQPQNLPKNLQNYAFDELLYWERETFLKLLQYPAELVQFSYPRFQADRPVLPSFFLKEMERISKKPVQTKQNFKLYTPSSILKKILEAQKNLTAGIQKEQIPDFIGNFLPSQSLQHFNHSCQVTKYREQLSSPSEWEGILSSDPAAKGWLNLKNQKNPFSPTQLENYAKCPMIYFFAKILRLQPYEELDEFFTTLDRGSILHHILFQFFSKISPEKRDLKILISIAREQLEKLKPSESLLWEVEKEFFLGNEDRRGLLPAFWDYEKSTAINYQTVPRHFEISFGNLPEYSENIDPLSSPHPFVYQKNQEQYFFRGKIDRVEIADNGALLIVDYKSGILAGFQEMWKGEKLQLPIYLKAVSELLQKHYQNLHMAGGAFYSLKKENDIEKKLVFVHQNVAEITDAEVKAVTFPSGKFEVDGQPLTLEKFVDYIFDYAINYIKQIRQGKFPHTLNQSKCRRWDGHWCEFFPLCRVNWYKTSFLNRNQEQPLKQ